MDFARSTHINVPELKVMVNYTLQDDRVETLTVVVVCRTVSWG